MPMVLRTKEAAILNGLRSKKSQRQIAEEMGISRGDVGNNVARLLELSVIKSLGNGRYEFLIESFEISDEIKGSRNEKVVLIIPKTVETYIRDNYDKKSRRELAKVLKLDKVKLNMMILQLGLGGL
jgi:DNA-binding Lrp family transcriptional regulator